MDRELEDLANKLGNACRENGYRVATAESCTGGWIAQVITSVAGSSDWFDSGFVTYSNDAKQAMLGVPSTLFEPAGPGAVSEETVRAMTAGALANSHAQLAVAVSGIAGPGGGSSAKPVGTVWFSWQRAQAVRSECVVFPGDREQVRRATLVHALKGLIGLASG